MDLRPEAEPEAEPACGAQDGGDHVTPEEREFIDQIERDEKLARLVLAIVAGAVLLMFLLGCD